jgi:hypothetical protein
VSWIYDQARRLGETVTVTVREPTTGRAKDLPPLTRGGTEPEAAFVQRGQSVIAEHLAILNGMLALETDVTSVFRPGPQAPGEKG